ncbi:MAG: hypothetical protein H0Z37_04905 [Firmicutes bacterium]|nr:hypothetical protein [Bacillota bacterium]
MPPRFVPTGHADLDQLRRDGLAAVGPLFVSVAAGAAAGVSLIVLIPLVYLIYAVFHAAIGLLLPAAGSARDVLLQSLAQAGPYARYAWLSGLLAAGVGAAYAVLRRWTVLRRRYVRVGPWEVGMHTLFAAAAGYAGMMIAALSWAPVRAVHAWLFWAWGPVFAWLLSRLQDAYILWIGRPGWKLQVESAVRVLLPRRFHCPGDQVRVEADPASRTVSVVAAIDASEAVRARELIQAIPHTSAVAVEAVGRKPSPGRPEQAPAAAARSGQDG